MSFNGYFDLKDCQCEEMMTCKCIGTFKSIYRWFMGERLNDFTCAKTINVK